MSAYLLLISALSRITAEDDHSIAMATYNAWNRTNTSGPDVHHQNQSSAFTNTTVPIIDSRFYFYVFTGLTLAVFVTGILRVLQAFHVFVQTTRHLHQNMLDAILKCPILFFDTNPVGEYKWPFLKSFVGYNNNCIICSAI